MRINIYFYIGALLWRHLRERLGYLYKRVIDTNISHGTPIYSSETPIEDYKLKLDIRTASYEEIMQIWSHEQTQYAGQEGSYKIYEDGTLYHVFKNYFGDDCKIDTSEIVK